MRRVVTIMLGAVLALGWFGAAGPALAAKPDSGLAKLNHIIVIFLENRSFDHYFGALPYAPGSPYHQGRPCADDDHACVDGLHCKADASGAPVCDDWNAHADGRKVFMLHADTRCIAPDLDHEWQGSHRDVNFAHPEKALTEPLMDGFVEQNDIMAPDTHRTGPAEGGRAMTFYDQADIPFYYDLAEKFAISDRYFSSVLGASDPNHAFHLAGSFFGHITDEEVGPPRPDGYKPVQGTIYDLLTAAKVDWAESYQDIPEGAAYLRFVSTTNDSLNDAHFIHHQDLLDRLKGKEGAKPLPSVVWVNARIGYFDDGATTNNEHPSSDIQRGQAWVSQLVAALRGGPYWKDSAVLITYDEGGGFYDHVAPPAAPQGGGRTPDGIEPGACADASNLPDSGKPGHGADCFFERKNGTTHDEILGLCPQYDLAKPYPADCPDFDQLGFRVPLMVISPFAKQAYVSHQLADHTSMLALIEKRFLTGPDGKTPHLTARDQYAWTLEDMFDFKAALNLETVLAPQAPPPAVDCTPRSAGGSPE
ncbi:MAG: phospholipase C [Caulobacterales bacterium]